MPAPMSTMICLADSSLVVMARRYSPLPISVAVFVLLASAPPSRLIMTLVPTREPLAASENAAVAEPTMGK